MQSAEPSESKRHQLITAGSIIGFAVLVALWWGLLWFVLPVEWLQGTLPSLVLVHVAPPPLVVATWWAGKRAWNWRVTRAEERATAAGEAEKKAELEKAKAAHQEKLDRRHALVECRAVWAEFARMPGWAEAGTEQCELTKQAPETIRGIGRDTALISSLERVFKAAFKQCEATAWLPVVFVDHDPNQSDWAGEAWQQAVKESGIEYVPSQPHCKVLTGAGVIPDRLITMFEHDPACPAVILLGMDSPLADPMLTRSPGAIEPGHAVVAVLIGRPELLAPGSVAPPPEEGENSMTPFWERNQPGETDPTQWGRIPPPYREGLWNLSPIATLHRAHTLISLDSDGDSVKERKTREAISEAHIDAGLRDWPFEADKQGAQPKPAQPEPELSELGWLVHNSRSAASLVEFILALEGSGYEKVNPSAKAGELKKEFGEIGKARSVLMLAEALVCAAQLQKPVLVAETCDGGEMRIGFARPVEKPT
ncbi:MAG: hypothetical protein FWD67_05075 [Betaproteobacteria bacterium]|nr:hypothetical protein [Betaproteobacteria bacterium]